MADNPKPADKRRDDTMGSFLVTGMIGTAMLIAIPPLLVWLLFALVRWFVL